jgi:predicted 3-demethylubiquinone-9 3-methyltransferase (glyoxalase superfamily)
MKSIQKITPHLWFDKEATEAANFYVSTFPNSKIKNTTMLHNTPSGSVDIVNFELLGLEFQAISAGPLFKFNPSISFHVTCKTKEEVDEIRKNSRMADRCSWNSEYTLSVKDMVGCRISMGCPGKSFIPAESM